MKTLNEYIVQGALYQSDTGPEAQVNDQVKLFLNTEANPGFPEFVVGVIQHPIVKVQCGTATSYDIEYDEADLDGAANFLVEGDIVDSVIITAYDTLNAAFTDHLADPEAAHAASAISSTPAGNLSSTTVQAALNELDSEKQPLDSDLTAISALTTTAHGRSLLTDANGAATIARIGAAPALGSDDNYVTDAEKVKLGNLSGVNTGDETAESILGKIGNGQTIFEEHLPQVNTPAAIVGSGEPVIYEPYVAELIYVSNSVPLPLGAVVTIGLNTYTCVAADPKYNEFSGNSVAAQRSSLTKKIRDSFFEGGYSVVAISFAGGVRIESSFSFDVDCSDAAAAWDVATATGGNDAPPPLYIGRIYIDELTGKEYIWNGTAWDSLALELIDINTDVATTENVGHAAGVKAYVDANAGAETVAFFDDFENTKKYPAGSRLTHGDSPIVGPAYRLHTPSGSYPADNLQIANGLIAGPNERLFYLASSFANPAGKFSFGFRYIYESTQYPSASFNGSVNVTFKDSELVDPSGSGIGGVGGAIHCNLNISGVSLVDYYDTDITCQGSAANDTLTTSVPHGLQTGWPLHAYGGGGVIALPLVNGSMYFAIRISDTVIKVALTREDALAGIAINLTSDGTGSASLAHAFMPTNRTSIPGLQATFRPPIMETMLFQAVAATDTISAASGNFRTGDAIMFEGAGLPSPLVANKTYFANVVGGVVKASNTYAEAFRNVVVDLTTNGSANQTMFGYVTPVGDRSLAVDQEQLVIFRVDGEYLEVEVAGVGSIQFWSPLLPSKVGTTTHFWWEAQGATTGGGTQYKQRPRLLQTFAEAPKIERELFRKATELAGRISSNLPWQMPGFEINNTRHRVASADLPSGVAGRLFGTGSQTVNGSLRATGANVLTEGGYLANVGTADVGGHVRASAAMSTDMNFTALLSSVAGSESSLASVGLLKTLVAGEFEEILWPIELVGAGDKLIKLRRGPNNDDFVTSGTSLNGVSGFGFIRVFRACITGTSYQIFGEITVNGNLYFAGKVTDSSTNNVTAILRVNTADAGGVVVLGARRYVSRVKPS